MLRIAICDDNPIQNDMTRELLEAYGVERKHSLSVQAYELGTTLIKDVRAGTTYDVYLLDMIMPEKNGMDVAEEIRVNDKSAKIIFLTSTAQLAIEAYEVKAYHYLLKPLDGNKLWKLIDEILDELVEKGQQMLEIKSRGGQKKVKLGDLLYIDILNRAPCYHLRDGSCLEGLSLRKPFKEEVAEYIDHYGFALAGASMAVNLSQIDFMGRNAITMIGGEIIHPPKASLVKVHEEWNRYWEKRDAEAEASKNQ